MTFQNSFSTSIRRGAALLTFVGAVAPSALAADCSTAAKAAADLWTEYDDVAKKAGCVAGTAITAVGSGGATLPDSAAKYKKCFDAANKFDETARGMLQKWNDLAGNNWSSLVVGPRKFEVGGSQEGTIRFRGTRMFLTPAPVNGDLEIAIQKLRFRGKTEVDVCKYAPGSEPSYDNSAGENIWSFTIDRGLGNKGETWTRQFSGTRGHIVAVTLKGQSVAKSMKYRLSSAVQPQYASNLSDTGYLFRANDTYYRYTDGQGVDQGYPLQTQQHWQFNGREVVGAVPWDTGYIYLILEDGYFARLSPEGESSEGYPRKITNENWPGLAEYAEDIEAVVNWGNGKVYFFLDGNDGAGEYVRYDIESNEVDQEARAIEGPWDILGDHDEQISAAVNWGNGKAYFFLENGSYVRWDISSGETGIDAISRNWKGVSEDEIITAAFHYLK